MSSDGVTPHVKGYEAFFGFRDAPFSLAPSTRFLFDSASHAAARAQVAYALERREPVVVVTGAIGTGKTLLCRSVVEQLERRTFLSIIHDPMLGQDELLKQMLQDFGVISKDRTKLTPTTRHDLTHALQEFLLSLVPLQAHAVLVIDEAQHLQPEVIEQVRLVANIHDEAGTILQIILVGQPSLESLLARPELAQMKQRISRFCRLEPLGSLEVAQYISHRLAVARGSAPPHDGVSFAPEAITAIWRFSTGIPRVVNLLCDRALEAAYGQQARSIGAALIEGAARELDLHAASQPAPATPVAIAPALSPPSLPSPEATAEGDLPFAFTGGSVEDGRPHRSRLLLAAAAVVVAVATWFGVRALFGPEQTAAVAPAPSPAAPRQPSVQPTPAPSAPAAAPASSPAPDLVQSPPPQATASAAPVATPGAAAPPSAGGPFEIVVASFRTTTRASAVAAELVALGQQVRQRESDGWQQVLAGPYTSRSAAEEAQLRLDSAGYLGTKIVPAPR
jgi:type II secretory pathway predicted ATPase ExeA